MGNRIRELAHDIPAMQNIDGQMVTHHDNYPNRHLTWSIVTCEGVVSRPHIDTSGLATASFVVYGRKLWIVGEPKNEHLAAHTAETELFRHWSDEKISPDYRWEAMCLDVGDVL